MAALKNQPQLVRRVQSIQSAITHARGFLKDERSFLYSRIAFFRYALGAEWFSEQLQKPLSLRHLRVAAVFPRKSNFVFRTT